MTFSQIQDPSVVKIQSTPGRGNSLYDGAKHANGEYLLFLHADTVLDMGFYEEIYRMLDQHDAGAFDLCIKNKHVVYRVIEKVSSLRSRITKIPYGDQAHFVKKTVYDAVGGYHKWPLMEDVRFMQDIKQGGYSLRISRLCAYTSARRWQKEGVIYVTMRNWTLITLYFCGVSPYRLVKWYKSFRQLFNS